jgi:putative endonuclease
VPKDLSNRARGRWGEDCAVAHLRRAGFIVVDRNWRSPEREVRGELDIIASRCRLLVFCEVKTRRTQAFGGAAAAVDAAKQQTIRALAESWLRLNPADDVNIRFDVVAIEGIVLEHYEAAF